MSNNKTNNTLEADQIIFNLRNKVGEILNGHPAIDIETVCLLIMGQIYIDNLTKDQAMLESDRMVERFKSLLNFHYDNEKSDISLNAK